MSATYFDLSLGDFNEDWTSIGNITVSDDWASVPSIIGYRGDDLTTSTGTDPQTLAAAGTTTPVDVNANQTATDTFTTGGVTEFHITNPVVALQGSGTADAPFLLLHLNATGRQNLVVSYLLRDLDGSIDNAVQSVAVQYRIGETGDFTNIPAGYVADASSGPSLATLTTAVSVQLPAAANNQAQVQVRIITTNATGNDEWIGVDDIHVTSSSAVSVPTVQLSVDTAAGTEAGTTVVTLTATASAAVAGDQTVDVSVAGTGITAGDYSLSATQITILDGQTTGTVTFTVADDLLAEGLETAMLSIANPSSGIALGATVSQSVAITDDDASGVLSYGPTTLNEARALDGSVAGVVSITLAGDTFTGTNGDDLATAGVVTVGNVPAGLTAVVTRTSGTTAELTFTGAAASHANANDAANLTVTFANGAFASGNASAVTGSAATGFAINFADAGTPGTVQTFTPNAGTTEGSSDASTALALDGNWMVVADDEANVLRVYSRAGGAAVAEWSYETNGPMLSGELDLEAGTRIGNTLYFIGSHSNTKAGAEDNNREAIFAVDVSGTGAATQFSYVGKFTGLEAALATWDSGNSHGLGANYFGFTASAAAPVVPEGVNGFSIEGMTASQDGTQLFLAFRAPQSDTASRTDAVIVPVNVAGLLAGTPTFGTAIEIDLGGRGIRSIEKSADGGGYLILAGPAAGASAQVTHDFRLFRWDGSSSTATELDVNLDTLRDGTGGSFESIVDVLATSAGTLVQLLQDNGDTVWPGQSGASKDLAPALQQFQGNWVALGGDVTDAAGPVLAASSPGDNAANVSVNANLTLRFDEGVRAGAGSFVIHKASDGSVVETIAADSTNVTIAFNTVTINPSADLMPGTGYYLEASATALTDHAGNAWAGIAGATAHDFTTASPAPAPKVLITEVNSNAGGGDFFELYNYGTTAVDLTGWKWDDDSANFADAAAATFGAITLNAGEKLIVVASTNEAAFRTAWNNLPAGVKVAALGGPGLGAQDAIAVFNASGNVVASFNYKATSVTASDGTVIQPVLRADGSAIVANTHAGVAVGGTAGNNSVSAVWNEQSTGAPKYGPAQVGQFGAFSQSGAATSIGSPGVAAGTSLATPYTESFSASLGDFTAFSVDGDAANTWARHAGSSSAAVNGFGDTAAANDWLISKGFDLANTSVEYLSFTTWTQFADAGVANPEVKVKYSTNYSGSGSPALATWTDLPYTPAAENSQAVTPSGLIDLSAINGNNVFFAFQYTASGTAGSNSTSWRLDDVKLEGYNGAVMSIAATDAAKPEGDSGTATFTFTVTRAGDASGASSANWAVGGAAVDAADFGGVLPSGVVEFAATETTKTISVQVSGDVTVESSEAFTVTLSGVAGATLVQATAAGTIQPDDLLITKISAVQGAGAASAMAGQSGVTIEGIVTAWMPNLKGFYVQEEAADSDGNASTSEGVFVFYGNSVPAGLVVGTVGDVVRVTGSVSEFSGVTEMTTLTGFSVVTDNSGTTMLPSAMNITLPQASQVNWEAVEGMLVTVSSATEGGKLVVTDNFNLGRYGQVTLTSDDLIRQYTETHDPSVAGYTAWQAAVQGDQIVLDDGNTAQNPDPEVFGRGGDALTASNTLRAGDWVGSVTGIVDQFIAGDELGYQTTYRLQATETVEFAGDARPTPADIPAAIAGAEIKVASANVLNYFTTLGTQDFSTPNGTVHDGRGASNEVEFTRQQDKIVANLLGLDADVVGLMEMQNNGFGDETSAIDSLVDALNAVAGAGTYAYVAGAYADGNGNPAVTAGDDAIMVAIIYKPGSVTPVGAAAVPDVTDPAWNAFTATYGNRVPVAQTFRANADGELFTVVVNHFKSKGSVLDADIGDGQGANNQARMEAAQQLADWLATDPTGSGDPDVLLVGDFNAYGSEDPITFLEASGYDKVSSGNSYSFDGLWGSLDHALASESLTGQVTGTYKWAINAEEPTVMDYNLEFKTPNHDNLLYAPDAYRSSDHNPILVGLNLFTPKLFAGTARTDFLTGTANADILDGRGGMDFMFGGRGDDTYRVDHRLDAVVEYSNQGVDTVFSTVDYSLALFVENLVLDGRALRGAGNSLDNLIVGNGGRNNLSGLAGNDRLEGGAGDDTLAGGSGQDRFLFESGGGRDRVTDFTSLDRIVLEAGLNGSGIVDGASVLAAATRVGRDTVIDLGEGNSVTLVGVSLGSLSVQQFEVIAI